MALSFPQIFTILMFIVVTRANQASFEPESYWNEVLPHTIMPSAIKLRLKNVGGEVKKDTSINVGNDRVGVNTGEASSVHVNCNSAATKTQLQDDPALAFFFLRKNLRQGKQFTLKLASENSASASFVPRRQAEAIPNSENKTPMKSLFVAYEATPEAIPTSENTTPMKSLFAAYETTPEAITTSENETPMKSLFVAYEATPEAIPTSENETPMKSLFVAYEATPEAIPTSENETPMKSLFVAYEATPEAIPTSENETPMKSLFVAYEATPEAIPTSENETPTKSLFVTYEAKPTTREKARCVTSLEAMVDFATTTLGTRDVVAVATEGGGASVAQCRRYEVKAVRRVVAGGGKGVVSCHPEAYAYAVFFCHATMLAEVYTVDLETTNGGESAKAVVVCHMDTTAWSPKHLALKFLGVRPGDAAVCHFLPMDHVVWAGKM